MGLAIIVPISAIHQFAMTKLESTSITPDAHFALFSQSNSCFEAEREEREPGTSEHCEKQVSKQIEIKM